MILELKKTMEISRNMLVTAIFTRLKKVRIAGRHTFIDNKMSYLIRD